VANEPLQARRFSIAASAIVCKRRLCAAVDSGNDFR
jgi:hypothetical protein